MHTEPKWGFRYVEGESHPWRLIGIASTMTEVIELDTAVRQDRNKGQQSGTSPVQDESSDATGSDSAQSHKKLDVPSNTVDVAENVEPQDTAKDERKSVDSSAIDNLTTSPEADLPKKSVDTQVKKRVSQLGSLAAGTREKRKSQLADLSAAATNQPVKLNTLEKSKLDWETYKGSRVASSDSQTMSEAEREELDAQTQGGGSGLGNVKGYLHRKDFLDRVKDRLDANEYDAHST